MFPLNPTARPTSTSRHAHDAWDWVFVCAARAFARARGLEDNRMSIIHRLIIQSNGAVPLQQMHTDYRVPTRDITACEMDQRIRVERWRIYRYRRLSGLPDAWTGPGKPPQFLVDAVTNHILDLNDRSTTTGAPQILSGSLHAPPSASSRT